MSDLILRWAIGDSDTITRLKMSDEKFSKFIRMAKLSVYSFQKFFDADFIVGFNGSDLSRFQSIWDKTYPDVAPGSVTFFNQKEIPNPYPSFFPLGGVWWKWVPFRFDSKRTEISIDTDIICLSEPKSWHEWIKNDIPLMISYEAIPEICEATCGDLWQHIVLNSKQSFNCGIIGQKRDFDGSTRFFELTELVDYGSYNGNFITEQGLFNILYYSLKNEGINNYVLPYETNMQAKHLVSLMSKGFTAETVHFTAKSKEIFYDLFEIFKNRVDQKISDVDLLSNIFELVNSRSTK